MKILSCCLTRVLLLVAVALQFVDAQAIVETRFASRVSQQRLLTTVRELVKLGNRWGGTESGDRAVAYLERKFKSFGLHVEVIEEPERLVFTHTSWSLRVEEPKGLRRLIKNEWLAGFSPSVALTKAELVGLPPWEDLEDNSLKGKAILLESSLTDRQYQRLAEAGVSALLLISPRLPGAYTDWALIENLKASETNRVPLFNLSRNSGEALIAALERREKIVISFSALTKIGWGRPKTVVATLPGKRDSYYLICAHGDADSGGPGADDNASGVSGVVELARTLGGMVRTRLIPQPEHSIKFVVWGAEIYSTQHYVRSNADELEKIQAVLNYDEIGTGATRNCLYFESNDVEHNARLLRTLEQIGEEYVGKRGFWEEATTNPSQGGTDSYVFLPSWLRRLRVPEVEIPSVTIYTGAWNELKRLPQTEGWHSKAWKGPRDTVYVDFSAYYHSSLDIPERTTEREPFNMTWAVKAVGIALLRLAW